MTKPARHLPSHSPRYTVYSCLEICYKLFPLQEYQDSRTNPNVCATILDSVDCQDRNYEEIDALTTSIDSFSSPPYGRKALEVDLVPLYALRHCVKVVVHVYEVYQRWLHIVHSYVVESTQKKIFYTT